MRGFKCFGIQMVCMHQGLQWIATIDFIMKYVQIWIIPVVFHELFVPFRYRSAAQAPELWNGWHLAFSFNQAAFGDG